VLGGAFVHVWAREARDRPKEDGGRWPGQFVPHEEVNGAAAAGHHEDGGGAAVAGQAVPTVASAVMGFRVGPGPPGACRRP
jgi:hypothetical protein